MATDPGGNYVDENSDYSFRCGGCSEWFSDIDTEGKYIAELPAEFCLDCFGEYQQQLKFEAIS